MTKPRHNRQPILRPSRAEDAIALWGAPLDYTFRGITAELDGKVMGIAGVMFSRPAQAFLTMDDSIKGHKRFVVQCVREFRAIASEYDGKIFAIPDRQEETARVFLSHCGFIRHSEEIYRWDRQRFFRR